MKIFNQITVLNRLYFMPKLFLDLLFCNASKSLQSVSDVIDVLSGFFFLFIFSSQSRQYVDIPLNHLVSDKILVYFLLQFFNDEQPFCRLRELFLNFKLCQNSSRLSSMLPIDFSCFSSQLSSFFFLTFRFILSSLMNLRFFFSFSTLLCSISSGVRTASSNSSVLSFLMLRLIAMLLILARKLAWQTLGCLLGQPLREQMCVGLIPFLLWWRRFLIFYISMSRSICLIVNWLNRSSEDGKIFLFSNPSFQQYLGTYMDLIRFFIVVVSEFTFRFKVVLLFWLVKIVSRSTVLLSFIYYQQTQQ